MPRLWTSSENFCLGPLTNFAPDFLILATLLLSVVFVTTHDVLPASNGMDDVTCFTFNIRHYYILAQDVA